MNDILDVTLVVLELLFIGFAVGFQMYRDRNKRGKKS